MLRTADEIRAQVEEAYEDHIMATIDRAARERKLWVLIPTEDVPNSVAIKLKRYGYNIGRSDSVNEVKISWGLDAE